MSCRNFLCAVTFATLVLYAGGCSVPTSEYMTDVDPISWRPSSPVDVAIENYDTAGFRKLGLLVVYTDEFEGRDLPLTVRIMAPDSTYYCEELTLAPGGKRRKQDDFHVWGTVYRDSVQFVQGGWYVFTFTPLREIKGVKAIGLGIDPS